MSIIKSNFKKSFCFLVKEVYLKVFVLFEVNLNIYICKYLCRCVCISRMRYQVTSLNERDKCSKSGTFSSKNSSESIERGLSGGEMVFIYEDNAAEG